MHRSTQVKRRAAEMSDAAYSVLLQSGIRGCWIDLELDIWRTLEEAAGKPTEWEMPAPQSAHGADTTMQPILDRMTDAAYRTALRHGLRRPFLDVELELYRALQRVLGHTPQACL